MERTKGLTTDARLTGSKKVRRLQTLRHAKAKDDPNGRFHALADKVWRMDSLKEAWSMVRRNGGLAGVDGESIADVEAYGVARWLGAWSQDLRLAAYCGTSLV